MNTYESRRLTAIYAHQERARVQKRKRQQQQGKPIAPRPAAAPRHRAHALVIYMPETARMMAFMVAIRVAAAVRNISAPHLMLQVMYAALDQWGEIPEGAKSAMEDYPTRGRRLDGSQTPPNHA